MEPLTHWIDFLEDILRKVASQKSDIALIHHITPDGIIASLFLRKVLESMDTPVEITSSLPEDLLFTMERIDEAKTLILVDLVPLGPGPISVAHEFFPGGFLLFDHESINLGYDLKNTIRLNPRIFSLNLPTSYSAYLVAERIDPSSHNLSWLVQIGIYGEMTEFPKQEAELNMETIRYEEDISRIYQAIFSLSSVLGERGSKIVLSTLESSIGEFSILDRGDPLHAIFWDEANQCLEEIAKQLSKQPKIIEKNLVAHQVSNPALRFIIAELGLMKYKQEIHVAYYCNDVLARICVRRKPSSEINIYERVREILSSKESSIVGREDFADVCIRSEFLEDLLKYMIDLS